MTGHRPARPEREVIASLAARQSYDQLMSEGPGENQEVKGETDLSFAGANVSAETVNDLLLSRSPVGTASFGGSRIDGEVLFKDMIVVGPADFSEAVFESVMNGETSFDGVIFHAFASFKDAIFKQRASFEGATFEGGVSFQGAKFLDQVYFENVRFLGDVSFADAELGTALFSGARFAGKVDLVGVKIGLVGFFNDAVFTQEQSFGPLSATYILFDGSSFAGTPRFEIAADSVSFAGAEFSNGAHLRIRFAAVDLDNVRSVSTVTLSAAQRPFSIPLEDGMRKDIPEIVVTRGAGNAHPELLSLQGVDGSWLRLIDVNLTHCTFQGAHAVDKILIEGRCTFPVTPVGWKTGRTWPGVWRWSTRRTLADEHAWRARRSNGSGWESLPLTPPWKDHSSRPERPMDANELVELYRNFRRAQEDHKNEPGAADFYYGEMEMRRNDKSAPLSERLILTLYWAMSGYGLRAFRALIWLVILIIGGTALFTLVGFGPTTAVVYEPLPSLSNTSASPSYIEVTREGTPPGWHAALDFSIESTTSLLRQPSNPPNLTSTGLAMEIALRIGGPALLGLAALGVRARVKR
jgi:uncharacterized protein YjbI with pentapeptide repeats